MKICINILLVVFWFYCSIFHVVLIRNRETNQVPKFFKNAWKRVQIIFAVNEWY